MQIQVVGIDPSLRNWGMATGMLDLQTGYLDGLVLSLVQPKDVATKQVRQNSKDLAIAKQLAAATMKAVEGSKAVFVEVPVGSQSARAMASYGVCVGVLGAIEAMGIPLIEVSPTEVKVSLTGNATATKDQMIQAAMKAYPQANFPMHRGKVSSKAEHVADAIAAIHAGVNTPAFQGIMRILKTI